MDRSGVKRMSAAVDMRLERDAGLVELAQFGQRHDLEAARIGEDRVWPLAEAVQAAEFGDALRTGPHHEVVGVPQDDVGPERLHLVRIHGLHGPGRADRHEGRRADGASRRPDQPGASRAVLTEDVEAKSGTHEVAPDRAEWGVGHNRLASP